MATPPLVALVLGLAALPACLWVTYADLSRMKIPNAAVLALVAVFAAGGLALLPVEGWTLADWAWRWLNLAVILLLGMALNAVWLIGAGDAKFAAAAALFVAASEWRTILWLYALCLVATWLLHRLAKHTVGRRLAPGWASWDSGKRFPMGIALVATLLAYLGLAALA